MIPMEDELKLFETSELKVFHNRSGEIFIKNKKSGHELRIGTQCSDDLMITATQCVLVPAFTGNVAGMKTRSK